MAKITTVNAAMNLARAVYSYDPEGGGLGQSLGKGDMDDETLRSSIVLLKNHLQAQPAAMVRPLWQLHAEIALGELLLALPIEARELLYNIEFR